SRPRPRWRRRARRTSSARTTSAAASASNRGGTQGSPTAPSYEGHATGSRQRSTRAAHRSPGHLLISTGAIAIPELCSEDERALAVLVQLWSHQVPAVGLSFGG